MRDKLIFHNFSAEVRASLRRGGVGVLPTDTIYGVVGSALSKKTVERMYKVRGRNPKKPFIILIGSYADLARFGVRLAVEQKNFLQAAWRTGGKPTSVILPVPGKKFAYLHRGTQALAFRRPGIIALRRLLRSTGPLAAPSANPEGKPPATTIGEAAAYFGDTMDFYVDGGRKKGKPSRLVALEAGGVRILR